MLEPTKHPSFAETLRQLGPLPTSAQEAMLLRLEEVRRKYRPRQKGQRTETDSRLDKRLRRTAATANELARLLDGPNLRLRYRPWFKVRRENDFLLGDLKITAETEADVRNVTQQQGSKFLDTFCLTEVLRALARDFDCRSYLLGSVRPRGRGGPRRVAAYDVRNELFDLYAEVRQNYPDSGSKPGWGGPIKRFLYSALRDIGVPEPSEGALRGAFTRWKKRNSKSLINHSSPCVSVVDETGAPAATCLNQSQRTF